LLRVVFFAVVFQVAGLVWSWGLCVRFAGCWFTGPKHVEQAIRSAIKTSVASSWHFISTYYDFKYLTLLHHVNCVRVANLLYIIFLWFDLLMIVSCISKCVEMIIMMSYTHGRKNTVHFVGLVSSINYFVYCDSI